MAKHRQEDLGDWQQDARDLAKAERELGIENWVQISVGYDDVARNTVVLHSYDLPREIAERFRWIINWRVAKEQCRYPRLLVRAWYCYYQKRPGLKSEYNSHLGRLAAAKAQVTKFQRAMERHIAQQKRLYPLFYDESTDLDLAKFREKLAVKIENCNQAEERLRLMVENHRREQEHAGI